MSNSVLCGYFYCLFLFGTDSILLSAIQMPNSTNLCPITPPPPPPVQRINIETRSRKKQSKSYVIDECIWANTWPELQKACFLNKVCTYAIPKCCRYNNIQSILQEGPTCGLTALSMICGGTPAPEELLKKARQLSYTNNGEMFSARNLFKLICDTGVEGTKIDGVPQYECQLHEGQLNCAKVRDCLRDGACIFVAYPF